MQLQYSLFYLGSSMSSVLSFRLLGRLNPSLALLGSMCTFINACFSIRRVAESHLFVLLLEAQLDAKSRDQDDLTIQDVLVAVPEINDVIKML